MTNNFYGHVGQVADKIENNFYLYREEEKKKNSDIVDAEVEEFDAPKQEIPESVKGCFRFVSEFVRQQVDDVIKTFYLGQPVNLAMIEVTLFDHGVIYKRNGHTAFVRTLIDWAILPEDTDIPKIANGMATKFKAIPPEGYKKWDKYLLNEQALCSNIGKRLPESMKYIR